MIAKNEKGFILLECLMSLVIVSVVMTTLVQVLPSLLERRVQLEHEQLIFNELYQVKDQLLFHGLLLESDQFYTHPTAYRIFQEGQRVCTIYSKGAYHEAKLCL